MSATARPGLVCLDYDGVLVDSATHLLALAREAHTGLGSGRAPTLEDLALIETLTFEKLALRCGVSGADLPRYAEAMFALQRADRHVPELFDGIAAMLAALAARHHVVVVTASLAANVLRVLAAHGVAEHLSLVLDGTGHGDKAAHIADARHRFEAPTEQTWMVGDAISDVRAGNTAGVNSIAVCWGYQPRERLAAAGPDHLADTPADITRLTGAANGDERGTAGRR